MSLPRHWSVYMFVLFSFFVHSQTQNLETSSCTITGTSIDNVSTIKQNCNDITIRDLIIPAGATLDLTDLLNGTIITFDGNITLGYEEWTGPVIIIGGTNIRIIGSSNHIIDGRGALWWDGIGGNGGIDKPILIYTMKLYDSVFENINILNSPVNCVYIFNSTNVTFTGIYIDMKDGDYDCLGHNTDGFNVFNSKQIYFSNITVYNQDDCLAIKSGSDIYFSDSYCSGGHGISIGSVGGRYNNVVDNVLVSNCEIVDSTDGVRVKTNYNTTGLVANVVYKDVVLRNISNYGINIRTDYGNLGSSGIPSYFPITNLTLNNITGSVQASGTNIYILVQGASNWNWTEINVTGGTKYRTCVGIPEGSGITCDENSAENSKASVSCSCQILLLIVFFFFCFYAKYI